jgi:hypothetical protein
MVHVANMPNSRKYCKIATSAARASLSTAVPPVGLGIKGATVHWPDMNRLCRRVDLFQTRIASWGTTKRQKMGHDVTRGPFCIQLWASKYDRSPYNGRIKGYGYKHLPDTQRAANAAPMD